MVAYLSQPAYRGQHGGISVTTENVEAFQEYLLSSAKYKVEKAMNEICMIKVGTFKYDFCSLQFSSMLTYH